jgi:hypothetical protein
LSDESMAGGKTSEINFDYIKAHAFRVVHVDGAIGGLTPSRLVHAALYSERPAIPQRIVHQIGADGTLGPRIDAQTLARSGIVRELEVDVIMSAEVAQSLGLWLLERAREAFSKEEEQNKSTEAT